MMSHRCVCENIGFKYFLCVRLFFFFLLCLERAGVNIFWLVVFFFFFLEIEQTNSMNKNKKLENHKIIKFNIFNIFCYFGLECALKKNFFFLVRVENVANICLKNVQF